MSRTFHHASRTDRQPQRLYTGYGEYAAFKRHRGDVRKANHNARLNKSYDAADDGDMIGEFIGRGRH
jgi:hypothetical protein